MLMKLEATWNFLNLKKPYRTGKVCWKVWHWLETMPLLNLMMNFMKSMNTIVKDTMNYGIAMIN